MLQTSNHNKSTNGYIFISRPSSGLDRTGRVYCPCWTRNVNACCLQMASRLDQPSGRKQDIGFWLPVLWRPIRWEGHSTVVYWSCSCCIYNICMPARLIPAQGASCLSEGQNVVLVHRQCPARGLTPKHVDAWSC
jgi:hypothetical protein